jgi:hypothetical protein
MDMLTELNLKENYFIAFGYKPNDKHDLQFTFTELLNGTTKEVNPLSEYIKYGSNGEPNIKYNSDWVLKTVKNFLGLETL